MASSSPQQNTNRSDPIHDKYYVPLKIADEVGNYLFYLVAFLSLMALFVDSKNGALSDLVSVSFLACSIVLFALGIATRVYFAPRAEDARRQEFFATAFDVNMTSERTQGYYNNDATDPIRKAAAQTMENAFFSMAIALKMLHKERAIYGVYALLWLIAIAIRKTELTFVITSAQVVFSEQIIARWVRLEWLRRRFEDSYEKLHTLFVNGNKKTFKAYALTYVCTYEATKASGGISLSTATFESLNPSLTIQWDGIRKRLGI